MLFQRTSACNLWLSYKFQRQLSRVLDAIDMETIFSFRFLILQLEIWRKSSENVHLKAEFKFSFGRI